MQLIIESSDEKVLKAILELIRPFKVSYREVKSPDTIPVSEAKKPDPSQPGKRMRKLGIMPGLVAYMAPDFNTPLEDFEPYMN